MIGENGELNPLLQTSTIAFIGENPISPHWHKDGLCFSVRLSSHLPCHITYCEFRFIISFEELELWLKTAFCEKIQVFKKYWCICFVLLKGNIP